MNTASELNVKERGIRVRPLHLNCRLMLRMACIILQQRKAGIRRRISVRIRAMLPWTFVTPPTLHMRRLAGKIYRHWHYLQLRPGDAGR